MKKTRTAYHGYKKARTQTKSGFYEYSRWLSRMSPTEKKTFYKFIKTPKGKTLHYRIVCFFNAKARK